MSRKHEEKMLITQPWLFVIFGIILLVFAGALAVVFTNKFTRGALIGGGLLLTLLTSLKVRDWYENDIAGQTVFLGGLVVMISSATIVWWIMNDNNTNR